ncbi:DUF3108 domain-containing protein [Methylobacterium sp. 77]|uniref:DUF3108 domain-containing protein n=1 Tax=Methylobacterium sp. 77 TaxID=1101192 RepID=UPI00056BF86D|nr:DUF3108 domain-containing protein [Methylobacterium sp. 77]
MRHFRASLLRASLLASLSVIPASEGFARSRSAAVKPGAPATVTVDYGIALAGIPIGTAQVSGQFESARYRMDVSARLTGLVGAVTGGMGSARASGLIAEGPQPSAFAISTKTSNSGIAVRMALARGNVTLSEVTPPLIDMGDRVPVTPANKRGIVDPASALMMPAVSRGDLTDQANCNRTIPVFDGATRFNVVLSYGETRSIEKPGYAGPVLVCNARYQAIAGHRPDRPGVKFMEDNRDMSVWLAPVEGTRVLLPVRIAVRTTMGTNIIEATRWNRGGGQTGTARAPEGPGSVPVVQATLVDQ